MWDKEFYFKLERYLTYLAVRKRRSNTAYVLHISDDISILIFLYRTREITIWSALFGTKGRACRWKCRKPNRFRTEKHGKVTPVIAQDLSGIENALGCPMIIAVCTVIRLDKLAGAYAQRRRETRRNRSRAACANREPVHGSFSTRTE